MKKKILIEMNEIKYLFGYKRGVVISEQESKLSDIEEQEDEIDDTPIEDVSPSLDDEEDDIEDYGFDYEDEDEGDLGIDDEFQNKMRFKDIMKHHKPGSVGIGSGTRWDKESEKEWSPIKSDDLPLDKFLKSKYNKK